MNSNLLASAIYGSFVKMSRARTQRLAGPVWNLLWKLSCFIFSNATVSTMIHGRKVLLNYGYPYPIYSRCYPLFNQGFLELVHLCYQFSQKPLTLVDAGAAIGDTILLILANGSSLVQKFYALEGDEAFCRYLKYNLRDFPEVEVICQLLSDRPGEEKSLRRLHPGTASVQGERKLQATTLDVLFKNSGPIDLLKIDVDGYDGKVLLGSQEILRRFSPAVIFEWHPLLYEQTGNDWRIPFEILGGAGYDRFLWLTKFGEWSHCMTGYERKTVEQRAEECLHKLKDKDWHYDIVALHKTCPIQTEQFARFDFARKRISPY